MCIEQANLFVDRSLTLNTDGVSAAAPATAYVIYSSFQPGGPQVPPYLPLSLSPSLSLCIADSLYL